MARSDPSSGHDDMTVKHGRDTLVLPGPLVVLAPRVAPARPGPDPVVSENSPGS
jgi:hypothetical protein